MSCWYCHRQEWDIPDMGTCTFCGKAICTPPPRRPDGWAHGDECSQCEKLVCYVHMCRHSEENHEIEALQAFPKVGFAAGEAALAAAGSLLYGPHPPELSVNHHQIEAMSNLLISMLPGLPSLAKVLSDRPTESWSRDHNMLADTEEILIQFHRPFFTRTMVTGIFVLASRTAGACWLYGRRQGRQPDVRITSMPEELLNELAFRVNHDVELSEELVSSWLPRPDYDRARDIVVAISRLEMPTEPEQIAEWIDRTDRGTFKEQYFGQPHRSDKGGAAAVFRVDQSQSADNRAAEAEEKEAQGTEEAIEA